MDETEFLELLRVLPFMVMVFSRSGKLRYLNMNAQETLGQRLGEDSTIADIFSDQSAEVLNTHLLGDYQKAGELQEILEINSSSRFSLEILAQLKWWTPADGQPLLVLSAVDARAQLREHVKLQDDYRTLRSLIETSATPTWCIEYTEPVDLNTSDTEIIRQVFENDSHWYMCNKAMARLYDLPDDLDFNKLPVRRNFPRSPKNEAFVQELIDNDFIADDALSIDINYDGSRMYIANTVRPHIECGMLRRMWGTSRDITQDKRKETQLRQREHEMREVLSSVPDVILVVDEKLVLQAANPAFEKELGWRIDDWLGKTLEEVVDFRPYVMTKKEIKNDNAKRFVVPVLCADQQIRNYHASFAYFSDDLNGGRYVSVLRHGI